MIGEWNNAQAAVFQFIGALNLPPSPSALFCPAPALPARGFFCADGNAAMNAPLDRLLSISALDPSRFLFARPRASPHSPAPTFPPERNNPGPVESMGLELACFLPQPSARLFRAPSLSAPPAPRRPLPRRGAFALHAIEAAGSFSAGLLSANPGAPRPPRFSGRNRSRSRGAPRHLRALRLRAPRTIEPKIAADLQFLPGGVFVRAVHKG